MNPNEIWRPIERLGGLYEVSNLGRVRNKSSGRIRKQDLCQDYPTVIFMIGGKRTVIRTHRIVAEAFIPKVPGKPHVNHINGIHTDCRASNLEWVNPHENNLHSYRVLHRKPPLSGRCAWNKVLYEDDVKRARLLIKAGIGVEEIAESLKVSVSALRKRLKSGQYII